MSYLKWLLLSACGVLLLAQSGQAQNLVQNPGFSGTSSDPNYFIPNWRRTVVNAVGVIDVEQSLTGGVGGTASLHLATTGVAGSGSTSNGAYQIIPVTTGKKYQLHGSWRGNLNVQHVDGGDDVVAVYVGFSSSATVRAPSGSESQLYRKRMTYNSTTSLPVTVVFNYNNSMNISDPNVATWTWEDISSSPNLGWDGDTITATDSYMTVRVEMGTAHQSGSEYVDFDNMSVVGCQGAISGDLNGDCVVNFKDAAILANNWLGCGVTPSTLCW
jgi:hypothetical protein